MNKKYQVFISSTFADLVGERQDAIRTVLDLGHIPSGMEIFPAADVEQFEYIKKVVDECDYYVLIIGARYGSVDAAGVSFTEKEYDYAVQQKKTVLAFIHGDPTSIAVSKVDTNPALAAKLDEFRRKVSAGRLVSFWKNSEELKSRVTIALAKTLHEMPGVGWVRGNTVASEDLLVQNNKLRDLLDSLREENENLRLQLTPRLEGIAGFDQIFEVRYKFRHAGYSYDSKEAVNLTWAEIFTAVAPALIRPSSPAVISIELIRYRKENKSISRDKLHIFDTDENTIKVQLIALGLIDSNTGVTAKTGGIAEFISLTPAGKRNMLELGAVRHTTP